MGYLSLFGWKLACLLHCHLHVDGHLLTWLCLRHAYKEEEMGRRKLWDLVLDFQNKELASIKAKASCIYSCLHIHVPCLIKQKAHCSLVIFHFPTVDYHNGPRAILAFRASFHFLLWWQINFCHGKSFDMNAMQDVQYFGCIWISYTVLGARICRRWLGCYSLTSTGYNTH